MDSVSYFWTSKLVTSNRTTCEARGIYLKLMLNIVRFKLGM